MRSFVVVLLTLSCCATAFAQSTPPSAEAIMKEATAQAAREHKKVFVLFHASWCGWCHRMDSIMSNAACKKYFNDNFVIRHIVVKEADGKKQLENPGGAAMLAKYHGDDKGIPFWLIFDAKGKLLADCMMRPANVGLDKPGENSGCPATKEEVAFFVKVLKQTTSLNEQQLAVIEKNFIKK